MIKSYCIVILVLLVTYTHGQKDTLTKKSSINQLVGIEGGFTTRDILVGNKGDIGLSYFYNHNYFLAKTKISFTPGSNFGLLTKFFINCRIYN